SKDGGLSGSWIVPEDHAIVLAKRHVGEINRPIGRGCRPFGQAAVELGLASVQQLELGVLGEYRVVRGVRCSGPDSGSQNEERENHVYCVSQEGIHARIPFTTWATLTPVSFSFRPFCSKKSRSLCRPSRCRMVACQSGTLTRSSTADMPS